MDNDINLGIDNSILTNRTDNTITKVIIKKYFNWAVINHFVQSFMAIVLSLAVAGVALFLISDSYINNIDHPVWADIVISLLLGVWVSGKPKFFSRKKIHKDTEEKSK
jgi:hypothetical protein